MKNLFILFLCMVGLFACGEKDDETSPPKLAASVPKNGAVDVETNVLVEIFFDANISLSANHQITCDGVDCVVSSTLNKLLIEADWAKETNYIITIPEGAVMSEDGVPNDTEFEITFTTMGDATFVEDGMAYVGRMGVGWNLGNTLDTKNVDETYWGNPLATQALIEKVHNRGFQTLRVPITWQYHMGAEPDYTIEPEWLDRVEEVVNYGLSLEMNVIVNIHHDEEWLMPTYAELSRAKDQLGKVWTQIATRFKEYDELLVFETLNETRLIGSPEEWNGGTAEGRDCINQFNVVAVESIRNSGGNNSERYIMVSPYAASCSDNALKDFVLPDSKNLIVAVHNYHPYLFCQAKTGYNETWGTAAEKAAMDAEFDKLVDLFISKDIPVVLGEWGSIHHDNIDSRVTHASYYAEGCITRKICPIWWDNGPESQFGLINRQNYEWFWPQIADAIVAAANH